MSSMDSMTAEEQEFFLSALEVNDDGYCNYYDDHQLVEDGVLVRLCPEFPAPRRSFTHPMLLVIQRMQQIQQRKISSYQETIKGLRKKIQYDLKVIKEVSENLDSATSPLKEPIPEDEELRPDSMHRSESLSRRDIFSSNKFQSFRGGLLDIPKSPPLHNHELQNKQRPKKQTLQLNHDAKQSLGLTILSRQNSMHQVQGTPEPKEIKLDVLAAKLAQLPTKSRSIDGKSPEQFFETVPRHPALPAAPELHEQDTVVTATHSILTLDTTVTEQQQEPMLFHVTGAECRDKFGELGKYTGSILVTEGLPHGYGTMEYETGRYYQGNWKHGSWHGSNGTLHNPNGDKYIGDFRDDARHGHGKYIWDNGDVYIGAFESDQRHGRGEFKFHNGNVYVGEFSSGLFQGQGSYDFRIGKYTGDWKNGKYHGKGELRYTNGNSYLGEFQNSVAHGFGTEVQDGVTKRGMWQEGKPVNTSAVNTN